MGLYEDLGMADWPEALTHPVPPTPAQCLCARMTMPAVGPVDLIAGEVLGSTATARNAAVASVGMTGRI